MRQTGLKTLAQAKQRLVLRTDQHEAWHDLMERAMRLQIQKEKARMDAGLGWLASIGSTAPFVGLFGTVWGIMHALKDISAKGSATLDVVAGPIGEALIATALGIAVAIPAVIAYLFPAAKPAHHHRVGSFRQRFCTTIQDHLIQQTVIEHGHTIAQ